MNKKQLTLKINDEHQTNLIGDLSIPDASVGLVIFAHGSGSSRLSPRNKAVAHLLNKAGLSTLLFDLLSPLESKTRSNVFDIPLLTRRLVETTNWATQLEPLKGMPVGFFGSSTGAAATLCAATILGDKIKAIVSRGGRIDLAQNYLGRVKCPTLLLVGENDDSILELNRELLPLLEKGELITIPHATHLFEEPGALDQVSNEACLWFTCFFEKLYQNKLPA